VLSLLASVLISVSLNANASFVDNFEDGNSTGWLETNTGGTGSTGVTTHNGSQMAYASHTGNGTESLSIDLSYVASETLSFDMHALGNSVSGTISGVQISFLNFLNSSMGSLRVVNAGSGISLGSTDYSVDNVQHNYVGTMGNYAGLAGLSGSDPITKINLSFFATGYTWQTCTFQCGYNYAGATVWFDNVNVSAVPIPAALPLLLSGIAGISLIGITRKSIG